ncbi:MAG: 2-oxoglutarate and iron-dependent oxygenase domain-containing protein, partial [Litorimonas sp.]
MIPRIDAVALARGEGEAMAALRRGALETGFLTLHGTTIGAAEVRALIEGYRTFFHMPEADKRAVDMARTGSNRGWGAPGA